MIGSGTGYRVKVTGYMIGSGTGNMIQGQSNRIHDRIRYKIHDTGSKYQYT